MQILQGDSAIPKSDIQQSAVANNPLVLLQSAIDRGINPDQLGKLMDLSERWQANQAKKEFAEAMCSAQAAMPTVVKDAQNAHTRSAYARLETVNTFIRPVYTKHGFSVSFREGKAGMEGHCRVVADIKHVGGHSEEHWLDVPLDGQGIKGNANMTPTHGKGSTLSYGRRYLTLLIFNVTVADEDNDAAGALDAITPDEIKQLNDLIVAKKVDLKRFIEWAEVDGLDKILRRDFPKALDMLKRKKANGGEH